ncbi:tetratricopeptide repeat protein [Sinomonas sp. ASV322]|uniref:tetratricopeptide repeat protein n=1 Tax=Sinomonas sp. ASV322 TaxID=3041920 RepID=UPI0027DC2165|nr:tetratricopeptide repeat protein [Sinomonas sp. ASV322]MDQ4502073.1 tetratricopeptide repeat protein [Sinomonas sp. ASV322]
MSVPGSRNPHVPSASLRGAVDLSALKARATAAPPQRAARPVDAAGGEGTTPEREAERAPGAEGGGLAVEIDDANFPDIVQLSSQAPIVVLLWAQYSPESQRVRDELGPQVDAYGGRLGYATADIEAFPQLAQALGVQAVPTAIAFLKGQPIPLFQGAAAPAQSRQLFDELLRVAEANGVTGTVDGAPAAPLEEPPLPPLHAEAYEALERGDFAAAEAALTKAIAEQPSDHEAKAALAQVHLMTRVQGLGQSEAEVARQSAAENPDDVEAQLVVADLDLQGGHVEDAFARLVGFISRNFGPERDTARVRLLELFEVVGTTDPRVSAARQQLARALF